MTDNDPVITRRRWHSRGGRRLPARYCIRAALVGLLSGGAPGAPVTAPDPLDAPVPVTLSAATLGDALRDLAQHTNVQILYDPQIVAGRRAIAITRAASPREALRELLRGTGLESEEQIPGVVVIRAATGRAPKPSPPPAAQAIRSPTDNAEIEEIRVTAERRDERLQDVPISVTAFTAAAMDGQGTRTFDDIARLTPGLTFIHGINYNSESSRIAIRGVDSAVGAATTGVYIDDTPIQSRHLSFGTFNAYPALFDIERVEVLRGPQGTLFGSGSEGGTVRFITGEPEFTGDSLYGRAEGAGQDRGAPVAELGIAGGTTLIPEVLAIRASLSDRYEGGYVDRVDWHTGHVVDPESNAAATKTARVALKWNAAPGITVTPAVYYQTRHSDDTSAWWQIAPEAAGPHSEFAGPFRNGNAIANPSTDTFTLTALKVDWLLSGVRLVSDTSYFGRIERAVTDYTEYDRAVFLGDPFPPAGVQAPTTWKDEQRNWTQEVRLESNKPKLSWTLGAFYQHAFESTFENVFDPSLIAQLGFQDFDGGYLYYQEPFDSLDRQLAIYGQADAALNDALKVTAGLRYAHTDFTGHSFYAGPAVGPSVSSTGTLTENPVTPKLGATFRVAPDSMLYASVTKGYRIGGVNPAVGQFCYGGPDSALGAIGLTQVPRTYHSDSVMSYEVGSKNYFNEHRLLLDASAYAVDWRDIQQNVPLSACGFQFTANLGKALITGFDVQGQISLDDSLTLGATLGYTDARYTQTVRLSPTAASLVQDGDHIAGSPWTAALFAQAEFMLFGQSAYARADYQYLAKQDALVPNQDPRNGSFELWFPSVPMQSDAALRMGFKWGGLDASAFVENLFDSHPRLTVNQDVGTPTGGTPLFYVISSRPRTVGLTVTYRH
jgi:outer membrane receptor protein involved in Fe transport